jgi:hypothetical protein
MAVNIMDVPPGQRVVVDTSIATGSVDEDCTVVLRVEATRIVVLPHVNPTAVALQRTTPVPVAE